MERKVVTMETYPNYTQSFFINRHDVDFCGWLKPGSLLRYTQQIATNQCEALGFDTAYYQKNHFTYLLAKQGLVFQRVPRMDETITLVTMPEKTRRAKSRRITLVQDASGAEIAQIHSWWVAVDLDTRHILRRGNNDVEQYWNDTIDLDLDITIPKAEVLTPGRCCVADYLNCDTNGHINNCVYADLACASFSPEELRQSPVRQVMVNYHREVPMGDEMQLSSGAAGEGMYVCGTRLSDGMPAFEAYCCR